MTEQFWMTLRLPERANYRERDLVRPALDDVTPSIETKYREGYLKESIVDSIPPTGRVRVRTRKDYNKE